MLAMNAGPMKGKICFKLRRRCRPSKTNAALAITFESPPLFSRFIYEGRMQSVLETHPAARTKLSSDAPALPGLRVDAHSNCHSPRMQTGSLPSDGSKEERDYVPGDSNQHIVLGDAKNCLLRETSIPGLASVFRRERASSAFPQGNGGVPRCFPDR